MKKVFFKMDVQENVFHYVIFVAENHIKYTKHSCLLTWNIWK